VYCSGYGQTNECEANSSSGAAGTKGIVCIDTEQLGVLISKCPHKWCYCVKTAEFDTMKKQASDAVAAKAKLAADLLAKQKADAAAKVAADAKKKLEDDSLKAAGEAALLKRREAEALQRTKDEIAYDIQRKIEEEEAKKKLEAEAAKKARDTVCSAGTVWTTCGSACTRTCDKQIIVCTQQCVPKCQCPATLPFL